MMYARTRRTLPCLTAGLIALGSIVSGCGDSGIEVIDRTIDLPGTVLFSSDRSGGWKVYMSNFNSTLYTAVTSTVSGEQKEAVWHPDGMGVYFTTEVGSSWRIATIDDVSNASATFQVLTDTTGQQTKPAVSSDGTRLAFLNLLPTSEVPDLWIMDLTTGDYEFLVAGLNTQEMKFVPGSTDLLVLDGNHLKVVDTDTGVVTQFAFDTEKDAAFRHASFNFGAGGEVFCSGLEINRELYTLGLFDYNDPVEIERLTEGSRALVNSWLDLSSFRIDGEDFLLIAGTPSSGGFENRVGLIKVDTGEYLILFMRFMSGNNRWPEWTSVEHF